MVLGRASKTQQSRAKNLCLVLEFLPTDTIEGSWAGLVRAMSLNCKNYVKSAASGAKAGCGTDGASGITSRMVVIRVGRGYVVQAVFILMRGREIGVLRDTDRP
jgi:hypothetical protein